jgi:hypothetical protein
MLHGIGFKPKKILWRKEMMQIDNPRGIIRYDSDGFILDFKPGGGVMFTQDVPPKPLGKVRKLPNKQLWKVYYDD